MTRLYPERGYIHAETQITKEICRLPIKREAMVAKLVGCSVTTVKRVRALKRLRSHVFLPPETIRVMNENERGV